MNSNKLLLPVLIAATLAMPLAFAQGVGGGVKAGGGIQAGPATVGAGMRGDVNVRANPPRDNSSALTGVAMERANEAASAGLSTAQEAQTRTTVDDAIDVEVDTQTEASAHVHEVHEAAQAAREDGTHVGEAVREAARSGAQGAENASDTALETVSGNANADANAVIGGQVEVEPEPEETDIGDE